MSRSLRSKAPKDFVSFTEFARLQGVPKSQVTRWVNAFPPMPFKKGPGRQRLVSVSEARAWLAAGHTAPAVRKKGTKSASQSPDGQATLHQEIKQDPLLHRQAVARTNMLEAQSQRELARARRELGELVDREPMVRSLQAVAIAIKTEILEIPQSIADEIGAEFGVPVASVRAAIDRKVRRILNNISDGIARIG